MSTCSGTLKRRFVDYCVVAIYGMSLAMSVLVMGISESNDFLVCAGIGMLAFTPILFFARHKNSYRQQSCSCENVNEGRNFLDDDVITILLSLYCCISGMLGLLFTFLGCLYNTMAVVSIGATFLFTPLLLSILGTIVVYRYEM